MFNNMRLQYQHNLKDKIEQMIEDEELDPYDADQYYEEQLENWDNGYGDMMYDIYKDKEFE